MAENKVLNDEELEQVSGGKIWYFQYQNYNGITKNKVHKKRAMPHKQL